MSQSLAHSYDPDSPRLDVWMLPWLWSATLHACVLLVWALMFPAAHGTTKSAGVTLQAYFAADDSGGDDKGVELLQGSAAVEPAANNTPLEPAPVPPVATDIELRTADIVPPPLLAATGSAAVVPATQPPTSDGSLNLKVSSIGPPGTAAARSGAGRKGTGRGSGLSSRIGYVRTSVFGVTGEGSKFVYVFDRSGSMEGHNGAPLAAAKAQLIASLDNLGQTQQFQIIFYNERPRVFNPTGTPGRLVFGTEQNKLQAARFVGGIVADGGTEHEEALLQALRMSPDVIFFLTDADEPKLSARQLARLAQANAGTTIHTIEFGYGPQTDAQNFLVQLAEQNSGQHAYVDVSQLQP